MSSRIWIIGAVLSLAASATFAATPAPPKLGRPASPDEIARMYLMLHRQHLSNLILRVVGILVLINHYVLKLLLIFLEYLIVLSEHLHCPKNEVVEIQRSGFT